MGDHNESEPSTSSSSKQSSQPCRHFEFHEILLATDNFDESLVIGRGGFGKVYKGNVLNGSTVSVAAIKRLDPMSSQGASEFWAEVEMLSNFRHCHLVSLFGYCNYEKEMILVYEYMPNGTLEDHLHKLGTTLTWLQRLKICIGAARGLDYLHTGTGINVGVIHRDVKSSNILLNESWAAKISDFGLSKIGPTNQSSTYVNTHVKGTFGYLDPDYSFTGMLTRKSDVYAFGVVLLEVLCRKRAVDTSAGEEPRNLARWAQESIKEGNLKHIIDSSLKGEISPKCLKEFVRIVGRCLLSNPKQRPMMAEVVVSLNFVLTLQEKTNTSSQGAGKTVFGKMLGMFPSPSKGENSPSKGENSAHDDSKLSRKRNSRKTSLKVFKFDDLDRATRHFSVSLHKGSSEEVFLGWVDKNTLAPSTEGVGIAVAVKRNNEALRENHLEQWQDLTEISVLGGLTHPNINSLLGYCNDKQSQRFIIVYEYMPNQNLHYFLFGADHGTRLSWGTRVKIMIGVARGLAYMHSLKDQVIHRNVKCSNILLDQDFNAKLGGFGSARFGPKVGDTHVTTRVTGTRGYIDPSYLSTGHLSAGSDIYSFGVVLLETLTGKGASDIYDDHDLITWARPFLEDRSDLENITDPHLEKNYSLEGAFACAALALRCVSEDPKDRPSSEEVLRCLGGIYAHGDLKLSSIGDNRNTSLKVFKFADLERATRHFSEDLLLSEGQPEDVFLGWVDKNTFLPSREGVGIAVAVKRYNGVLHEELAEEWQTEVNILGWLGHPNIISLLGYCDDNLPQRLIVYEYMQNQNLSHFLFGANDGEQLSWGTRVKIMIGVARALAYIHSLQYQVIHRDVKSSNILLDQDFNAKLGGFGITRFGPEIGDTHITTRHIGTIGYTDPEYLITGHLSDGSDIYGFGVVLLEILTGQRAYKDNGFNLVKWARVFLVERRVLETMMDPRLRRNYSLEGAFGCATLALRCVANNRKDRPSSEEVLLCLEQIYLV